MPWIDRFEKLGRLVLWLSLSVLLVGFPVSYANQRRGEAELHEALKRAEAKLAEAAKPRPVERLRLSSMGNYMYGLNQATGVGHITFSNASPRSGVVCALGWAKNAASGKRVASLPVCQRMEAYASLADLKIVFAGGDLDAVCGKAKCELDVEDLPLNEGEKEAAK
jgi:hypothetical protein